MAESLKYLLIVLHVLCGFKLDLLIAERSFNGYSVLRVNPRSEHQVHYLATLAEHFENDRNLYQKFDFWK